MINNSVFNELAAVGWFQRPGAYVLVDGQYGSTGKGLFADVLSKFDKMIGQPVDIVTTNAGPNSGHTAVMEDGTHIMTQQLPVFSAAAASNGRTRPLETILNGGAVIEPEILRREMQQFGIIPTVHGAAALITPEVIREFVAGSLDAIASTGKGVGQAMASRVLRRPTTAATGQGVSDAVQITGGAIKYGLKDMVFVETAQGFSLGINSGFYPYTTSRECTVAQALADAGISPKRLRNVVMTLRTFPIRVGNTTLGNSGPSYPDQDELTWDEIGVEPELTTVTKRVRRVFSWSRQQFRDAVRVNTPDTLFLNFCNYMNPIELNELIGWIIKDYEDEIGESIGCLLLGFGPKASDVKTVHQFWSEHGFA